MDIRERYEGLQTALAAAGTDGCHFLVLCSIADEALRDMHSDKRVDLIEAIRTAQKAKWMDSEYTVTVAGSLAFLQYWTGRKWTRKDVEKLPTIAYNQYTEAIYFNPDTGIRHYRRRYFDTLQYSRTVTEGYVEHYYIYTMEES